MSKLKLMTIIGTRPEIIRLSEIIAKCDVAFNHILVHTGQNWDYTLNDIFFKDFSLRQPDYYLNSVGSNLGETIGNIIHLSYELMLKEKPDALLLLGDTNSALSAISAKRLKIPIFHMEAGNRCFDENVPEEINRRIVDHISDINLPYSEHARRNLIAEGIRKEYIFVTGSPLTELVHKYLPIIKQSNILSELQLIENNYILVSLHREENVDHPKHFSSLIDALNTVADTYQLPIIFSTHPRTQKKIASSNIKLCPLIQNIAPLGYIDYNKLQLNAFCVLSDSGSLAEEACLLRFPAVSIRTSTERPETIDKGGMIMGNITGDTVINSINVARLLINSPDFSPPLDYVDANISSKIISIIQGYTPIINQYIWHKD
ncbi:MAG: UDP-N-acetylglucosamine 2-epimerase (non-hydrolyzing) [Cellulosilyticum sp.]|nr:UDP-N-acetylglucosamine 2-epimerase (non-hydrolyzing) [Cellulosilyticum sp.]